MFDLVGLLKSGSDTFRVWLKGSDRRQSNKAERYAELYMQYCEDRGLEDAHLKKLRRKFNKYD